MSNAQGLNSLATIIKRLEAATSRLEDIALAQSSATSVKQTLDAPSAHPAAPGAAPRAPAAPAPPPAPISAPVEDSRSVQAYDEAVITGKLEPFLKLAGEIGGPVQEQSDLVGKLFSDLRALLQCASACAKPSDSAFMAMLGPLQADIEAIGAVKDKYGKDRDLANHLSAVSEGVPAVGWVTISPKPASHIGDMRETAAFYAHRVVKDYKEKDTKHVEWARGFLAVLEVLKKYVEEHHATGLTWNPKGGDATQFKAGSVPTATGGAPPPPPPPPPPPADLAPPPAAPAAGGVSAVFAELNRGEEVTKGLRKVNKDEMTHKNPALRASGSVPASTSPGSKKPSKPAKPASLSTKKPPKMELSGVKWAIENYENENSLIVENTELSHVVNIFNCKNTTIQIKGKINTVNLINCKKTSVLVDSLIASLSITASPSFTVQITGLAPTIQIDSCDSGQIYLSKQCLDVEIISAKCSAINVSIPEEGEEEGVFVERAVPEMLRTTVQNGKLVTTIVEHSG